MKTNYQNTSLLDIVFENRNKSYGAYVLRSEEAYRIRSAFFITIGSMLLLLLFFFITDKIKGEHSFKTTDGIHNIDDIPPILMDKPDIVKPETAKPKEPLAKATVRNTEMHVVKDNQPATDTFASQELLRRFDSGVNTNTDAEVDNLGHTDGQGTDPILDLTPAENTPPTYIIHAEVMPEYIGGDVALMRYLARETIYPPRERDLEVEGKAIMKFIVNTDGSVSDAVVLRSDSPGFSKEATRVVQTLKFKPGLQAGKPVRVQLVLPFHFRLTR